MGGTSGWREGTRRNFPVQNFGIYFDQSAARVHYAVPTVHRFDFTASRYPARHLIDLSHPLTRVFVLRGGVCRATVIRIIVAPSRHCWAVHPLLVVPPWFTRVELAPQEQPDPLILGR